MYIIEDEGVAADFAKLLRRKAAEGVTVAVLYDSVGSIDSDARFFDGLRAGGVAVCAFNPLNPLERFGQWGLWHRNHRKLVAVDQEVAFVGGINLSNVYSSSPGQARRGSGGQGSGNARAAEDPAPGGDDPNADNGRGWRDTQVELRGPVVPALAAVFERDWQREQCDGALGASPPAQRAAAGERIVQVIASDPRHGENRTYGLLLAAIGAAQRSVHVTMAYFAPGDELVHALCDASRRGVDVQLVLPGRSDVKLVMHAARSYYDRMLSCGIGIAEMNSAVMHAKTAVIDGVLSTVGSSNLDGRSIEGNSELDVVVLGADFGSRMERLFARDLAQSRRVDAQAFARRGLDARLMEWFAQLVEPLL
jgi:cardiolipin synthase